MPAGRVERHSGVTQNPAKGRNMASVRNLAYVEVETTDLLKWYEFGVKLCGFQVGEQTDDRLTLRMDNKAYRWLVRKGDQDRLTALGWEVASIEELTELTKSVRNAGYDVEECERSEARAHRVTQMVRFADPDGICDLHLIVGQDEALEPFASPHGTRFITGDGGMGHAFQLVKNWEAYRHLYCDILGFRLSDWIDMPTPPEAPEIELTFLHCNPRHHSFAFGTVPGVEKVGHIMVEATDLDAVGRAYDKVVQEGAANLRLSFGKHSNDEMLSFYMDSPSGFEVEFGTGGILIDDDKWTPARYQAPHYWGHVRQDGSSPKDPAAVANSGA